MNPPARRRRRWVVLFALGFVVILVALLVVPELIRHRRVTRACRDATLGMTREQADDHFKRAGIPSRGGAGLPGSPGEIRTYGQRGGRWFSISGFCSLQFAADGKATGIEEVKMTSLTILNKQLFQWTSTAAVAGTVVAKTWR
jgi:hypothetical protein